jgi:nucleotide-binding universal stress UspA family protein
MLTAAEIAQKLAKMQRELEAAEKREAEEHAARLAAEAEATRVEAEQVAREGTVASCH